MTKKDKLVKRFLQIPADFQYQEFTKLLRYFRFYEVKTGQTSGSRVRFQNDDGISITLHKPHPDGILKRYQLRQIREILDL